MRLQNRAVTQAQRVLAHVPINAGIEHLLDLGNAQDVARQSLLLAGEFELAGRVVEQVVLPRHPLEERPHRDQPFTLRLVRQRCTVGLPAVLEDVLPVALQDAACHLVRPPDAALLAPVDEVTHLDAPGLDRHRRVLACRRPGDELDQVAPEAAGQLGVAGHAQRAGLLARSAGHWRTSAAKGVTTYDGCFPFGRRTLVCGSSSASSAASRASAWFSADGTT